MGDGPSVMRRHGRVASTGRLSLTGSGAEGGRVPAQLAVMIIKAAHPIGRQGGIGIISVSCLLDGRGGHPPDLDFGVPGGCDFATDGVIPVSLGPTGVGIGLGQGRPGPGRLQPSPLQIERIPPQAQPMGRRQRQPDGENADNHPGPGSQPLHAG